jgi:HK97 gp10 family phage protein
MNIRATSSFRPGNVAAVMDRITARAIAATSKATQRVLDTALEIVPVDTGELQSSGKLTITLTGQYVKGTVSFDADHAAFVEFGTGIRGAASAGAMSGISYSSTWPGIPSQPYLRPALYQNQQATLGDFRDEGFKV